MKQHEGARFRVGTPSKATGHHVAVVFATDPNAEHDGDTKSSLPQDRGNTPKQRQACDVVPCTSIFYRIQPVPGRACVERVLLTPVPSGQDTSRRCGRSKKRQRGDSKW